MNTSSVRTLVFSYLICYAHSLQSNSFAINIILSQYFADQSKTVDLISYGSEGGKSEKIINEIFLKSRGQVAIKVLSSDKRLNTSSILTFDSIQNFIESAENMNWQTNINKRFKHLVHIPGATFTDIEKCIGKRNFDGFSIDSVDFLVNENEKSIELATVFMFTDKHCRRKQLKIINRFTKDTKSWEDSDFYPNKYRDFHNCTLEMASCSSKSFTGTEIASMIFEALAGELNYRLQKIVVSPKAFQSIISSQDAIVSYDFLDFERLSSITLVKKFCLSVPIHIERLAFSVPPGLPLTPLERILLPFQDEVWIAIVITLLIGLLSIQVINRCPEIIRNFVFGTNILSPTVNLMATFLTGGQNKLPGRNFARFLVVLFAIWSLVIRTCHQSELFKCLQQDLRKPRIKNLEELIDNNFTWYHPGEAGYGIIDDPAYDRYQGFDSMRTSRYYVKICSRLKRKTYLDICGVDETCKHEDVASDSANKATFLMTPATLESLYRNEYRAGSGSITLLDDSVRTAFRCVVFKRHSPYFEHFNEKIGELVSSGILHYYFWQSKFMRDKMKEAEETGPEVLTMEHLEIGFIVCGVPLALAIIVFIFEIVVYRIFH